MTTTAPTPHKRVPPLAPGTDSLIAAPVPGETTRHRAYRYTLAVTRLWLGWVFLWAFLDKTFGLGHATPADRAWIEGGSPTSGYLANAPVGPFADFYNGLAGAGWADWLFMVGLAGIGVALLLGVATRIAATSGAAMLVMMWTAVLPPPNNPFMDDHLVYAIVLVLLALTAAGHTLGLGRAWERVPLVARYGVLK